MAPDVVSEDNIYEEARRQRLHDNQKKFEELGVLKISKTLSNLTIPAKKSQPRQWKLKSQSTPTVEPRRSSRARNPVRSYSDDMAIDIPLLRKSNRSHSSSFSTRPLDEVKIASFEERKKALHAAEKIQSSLQSENPSFVKSMVRSHVYSCFWLGLPSQFCKEHLSNRGSEMVLEDENGNEYDAVYIGSRAGLSGGWRGFALEHKLDDGDALVFELVEPTRLKIYIVRVSSLLSQRHNMNIEEKERSTVAQKRSKRNANLASNAFEHEKDGNPSSYKLRLQSRAVSGGNSEDANLKNNVANMKLKGDAKLSVKAIEHKTDDISSAQKLQEILAQHSAVREGKPEGFNLKNTGDEIPGPQKQLQNEAVISCKRQKIGSSVKADSPSKEMRYVEDEDNPAFKPRKKPVPRLFRKKLS
ncbi:putative B3 domain-containing protein At5g58280 isoform X2 [Tripterygium wilfordii]|uniref:putative B3 domain-containing protein At5g58280 isoform X2 n=1 Tax=Tripterygium wilfordii TaxID=458696 RepID=UPI0018F83029|nr:putative B3 domain-containing protein At5g58280 isoform X2 [Tripterygium wilfordii]